MPENGEVSPEKKKERARETLFTAVIGVLLLLIFLASWIFWIWPTMLRAREDVAYGPASRLVQLRLSSPPILSAEDSGELVISVRNATTGTVILTTTLDFAPEQLVFEEKGTSNKLAAEVLSPGEIRTYKIPVRTTALVSATVDSEIAISATVEVFGLDSTITTTLTSEIHTRVDLLTWGEPVGSLPGLRSSLLRVDFKVISGIAFGVAGWIVMGPANRALLRNTLIPLRKTRRREITSDGTQSLRKLFEHTLE